MGLGLIIIAGAELLTANSCYLSAAVFEVSCRYASDLFIYTDLLKSGLPSPHTLSCNSLDRENSF